jgi:hypothetical protein
MLEVSTLHFIPYLRTNVVRIAIPTGRCSVSSYMLLDGGVSAAVLFFVGWLILGS